jgi:predicted acyl esterase
LATRQPGNVLTVASLLSDATYDSAVIQEHYPATSMRAVRVPTLGCVTWQDDMAGSRSVEEFAERMVPETTWFVGANGYHGMCDDDWNLDRTVAFFDHFVRGVDNGFDRSPHVVLVHEAVPNAEVLPPLNGWVTDVGPVVGSTPGWTTTHQAWPVVQPHRLHLGAGGHLLPAPAAAEGSDSYVTPVGTSGSEDSTITGGLHLVWKVPPVPGGALTYSSAPFDDDVELYGPASADLWVSSTAINTDLQVTISELRPDGQEVFVGRGWLRASRRALDPDRSTELRPFQTHQAKDEANLTPGQPTLLRVEVFPFNHVFRAGSALRLTIDAQLAPTGLFTLTPNPIPAQNTIFHGGALASSLVVGVIPGGRAGTPFPRCDTVISEPCRPTR